MAKSIREKIKLVSTAETGFFYTTTKNKRTTPEKLEMMKFDPKARKHVLFKEAKIKYLVVFLLESPNCSGFLHLSSCLILLL